MSTIEIPDDEVVVSIVVHAEHLTPQDLERYLAAFASISVQAGLEQVTVVQDLDYVGLAW